MDDLRRLGPAGLDRYLARFGPTPAPALDALCAQHDAHTALLYWHTDLDAAVAEARRRRCPIVSLRLLGRLDQARSCANSRFFRASLYTDPQVQAALRTRFVLHWQSVRPVPIVTIDFGDGRRVVKAITGNSMHLVLDADGRPVDALPGLLTPAVFAALLQRAHRCAMTPPTRRAALYRQPLPTAAPLPPPPSRAVAASLLTASKHRIEAPLLRAIERDVDRDTATNLGLYAQVQAAFAAGGAPSIAQLVEWIYRALFLMPLDDPMLGLDVPDPIADLDLAALAV